MKDKHGDLLDLALVAAIIFAAIMLTRALEVLWHH
jgi:hypothetical protein